MGVYYLLNVGENSCKLDVYINDCYYTRTFPGKLTPIIGVEPGDTIKLVQPGFFGNRTFNTFVLTERDFEVDDNCHQKMQLMAMRQGTKPYQPPSQKLKKIKPISIFFSMINK